MPTESISFRQNPDDKHAEKKEVPRFASFKSRTPLEIQSQGIKASGNSHWLLPNGPDNAADESRSRPCKAPLNQYPPRAHHRSRRRGEPDSCIRSAPTRQESEPCEKTSKPFVVDRVGDVDNLKFGALHKHATAVYFRFGAGNIVGSSRNQKIDQVVSTDKGLVLSDNTHGLPRNGDRYVHWNFDQEEAIALNIKSREGHEPAIDSAAHAADYIPLEAAQRATRRREDDGLSMDCVSSSDEHDTRYRSLNGNSKFKEKTADPQLKYDNNTSSLQETAGSSLPALGELAKRQCAQLSERLDSEPTNFEAWAHLISAQDNILGLDQDPERRGQTNAERHSTAEIKLSIFEKALEKVKDLHAREVLLLGMMHEATKTWEADRVSSCWKGILRQNPQSLRLWVKYLDFVQTTLTSFRFDEVQSAYLDCLSLIQGARTSVEISLHERNKIFNIQIYVVLRMTLFMRESGYAEHATAAWQAMLEFVFFKPTVVQAGDHENNKKSDEAQITMFENFWDSEIARIGEEGAEGWASFHPKQGKPPPPPRIEPARDVENSKDHWKSWLASERKQTLLSREPSRTTDSVEENDPYRIILFSDIRPFLIDPPSLSGQQLILDAFIAFCCLPPFVAEGPDSLSRVWGTKCFLRNDVLRVTSKLLESWKLRLPKQQGSSKEQNNIDEEDSRLHSGTQDPFQLPIRNYQESADTLFAGQHWFSAFDTWQELCSGAGGPVNATQVLRSLNSLISIGVGGEAVAIYVLGLELQISPGTVKRTAKNILRKRPFSIVLLNAYALIEYRLADSKTGEGVLTTSLKMSKKLDEVYQRDTVLLWRTWIWETLSANSPREALVRLLAIGSEEFQMPLPKFHLPDQYCSPEPALLLRTERALVAVRDRMLSINLYSQATLAMECLMLFAYLRNGQSLSATISAFESNLALLSTHVSSTSSSPEYFHQSFARLLHYHATHTNMFRPSDIRSILTKTIAQFPQNTIFLSLYAWNEARFRIDDRLRSVIKDLVLNGSGKRAKESLDSVVPHFFAIYSELHRAISLGSNISTIRSTFERAVTSDSCAHCAGLWKLYFLFEHSRYEVERAKMVFWRGLKACPWAKDLYMLAFEYLRGEKIMNEVDLTGIYELLGEKGLRVHVATKDIFGVLSE